MPESFPTVSDDISFELLILHAVAEKGRPLKGARASVLRASMLWEIPAPVRRPSAAKTLVMHVASALVIASTIGLTPATTRAAWAQRQTIHLTIVDAQTGKPLADVVLRDSDGNAVGRTRADGKLSFSLAADSDRFTLERAGYQSVTLSRSQLGGSNLVSMRPVSPAQPQPPKVPEVPSVKAPEPPVVQPPYAPEPAPTAKPLAKPAPKATAKPAGKAAAPQVTAPRAPQVRVAASGDRYIVKPGDTLWGIAKVALGNPTLWPALYQANRQVIRRPNLIHPGQTLVIPRQATSLPPLRGTHTVVPGDTLWDIAEAVYGNPLRWTDVYDANRGLLKRPNLIHPGQTLVLPR